MFQNHPVIAADMIKNIPRLGEVAEIIRYQEKHFDGEGFPHDDIKGESIPYGARILKIAIDHDKLVTDGVEPVLAFEELGKRTGIYDTTLIEKAKPAFAELLKKSKPSYNKELSIEFLEEGMYLAEDVVSAAGVILGTKHQKVTLPFISTLRNYERIKQIKGMIKLVVPMD
jgi:HD-GYP domain-containing protein (c-di-GMP phosphodiesterase class II)